MTEEPITAHLYGGRKIAVMLAKRILNIPATSAPSERVFSAAANIINIERARLTSENANVVLFLKENEEYVNWTNKKADTT